MVNYFAYASDLDKKLMQERCPDCKPKFAATLHNYKLVFAGWSRQWRGGIASIKASSGGKVRGAVYEITDADLRRLDKYEGYPSNYNRLNVIVNNEDNEPVEAVTYIKAGRIEETKPSKEYLATIQQGYKDWGLF